MRQKLFYGNVYRLYLRYSGETQQVMTAEVWMGIKDNNPELVSVSLAPIVKHNH